VKDRECGSEIVAIVLPMGAIPPPIGNRYRVAASKLNVIKVDAHSISKKPAFAGRYTGY